MIHCAVHIACIYIYISSFLCQVMEAGSMSKRKQEVVTLRDHVGATVESYWNCAIESWLYNWAYQCMRVRSFNCAIDIVGCIAEHTMRVLSIVQSRVDCVAEHTRRLRNAWWHIVIALLFLCIAAMQTLRYARKLLYHSSVTNLTMKGTKKIRAIV